ncbi:ABC-F family ATP-binding cassette domain-containing protein [Okibacterium fritillariae]|uniref:ABC-F family ATP-binding cassette domain-containing protein n=1 Tax=Okibacterium fritillariae TaxID=123320 RepID=UPI00405579EB
MPGRSALVDYLKVSHVDRRFGDRRVLTDVSFSVPAGSRTGLVGENGSGKSTLLGIVAGEAEADAGNILRPVRTGYLPQEVRYDRSESVGALLERALAEARGLERELEKAAAALGEGSEASARRFDRALTAAERADVWSADARLAEAVQALGVDTIPRQRLLDEVSGGQRSRLALAAVLTSRPTALLLDEPTNHLDDAAAAFLTRVLHGWSGPVLFASHDRAFLDEAATTLVDLDLRDSADGVTQFGGGFSEYLSEKRLARERWERRYAEEQDELDRLRGEAQETARAVSHNAPISDNNKMAFGMRGDRVVQQISRRIRNAAGRLERLEAEQVRKPPAPLTFQGIPSGTTVSADEGALVDLRDVEVAGRLSLDRLTVAPRTRLLITGANGSGKSTALAVLAGRLPLASARGTRRQRPGLRIGLLEQDVRFADPDASPRRLYERALGEQRAERTPLVSLGLVAPRDLDRPVGVLSVGQQRRLALALIIARPPHLFLLDEPTNHLSLALATELEEALDSYPGAVVLASHDRWLRRRWTGEVLPLV